MDHQLHAAGFVEEALEYDRFLSRQIAEGSVRRGHIVQELRRGWPGDADLFDQPLRGCFAFGVTSQARCDRQLVPEKPGQLSRRKDSTPASAATGLEAGSRSRLKRSAASPWACCPACNSATATLCRPTSLIDGPSVSELGEDTLASPPQSASHPHCSYRTFPP